MPLTVPLLAATYARVYGIPMPILMALGSVVVVIILLWAFCEVPISYNVRNLLVRWITSGLTCIAFILVTGLLTAMLAFVKGMTKLTQNSGQPGNVIILSEGSTDEGFSNLVFSDTGDIENQPGIVMQDGKRLCSRETYLVVNQPIENPKKGRPSRRFIQMRGVDDPEVSAAVHGIKLLPNGRWFSGAGVQKIADPSTADSSSSTAPTGSAAKTAAGTASAIEVVIGEGVAHELAKGRSAATLRTAKNPGRLEIGDSFNIADRQWLIVGIMQSSGSTFDSEVWGKRSVIGPKFGKEKYSSLVLRAKDAPEAAKLKEFFKHYEKASVNPLLETEYFESLSQINKQFEFGIAFVTFFIAVGGVFGVMNTMFAAISQRTKDIGVLQLLGYGKLHIMVSFLLESLVIAIVGGLIGCAFGSLVDGTSATSVVGSGQGGGKTVVLRLTVDSISFCYCMLLTVAMGLLGGFLPAFSAVRLKPLEALR